MLALVGGIDQLQVEACALPRRLNGSSGNFRIQCHLLYEPQQNANWNGDVSESNQQRDHEGRLLQQRRVSRMVVADGLEHAPQTVPQMEAEQAYGDDVPDG